MTQETVHDDPVEAMRHAQASNILGALDDWLRGGLGRQIQISYDRERGVRVALKDERAAEGESIRDAAAQVATVLMVDAGDEAEVSR